MNDSDRAYLLSVAGAICLVCAGIALIVAAWRLGPHVTAHWVILTFQFVVAVVILALGVRIVFSTAEKLSERIDELRSQHEELAEKLRERTPSFVAVTVVVGQAVMLLADKAFKGEALPTVMVSMALLVFFWIGNELMVAGSRAKYHVGVAVWIGAALTFLTTVTIHRQGLGNLITDLAALDLGTKLTVGMFFFALILLPFVLSKSK